MTRLNRKLTPTERHAWAENYRLRRQVPDELPVYHRPWLRLKSFLLAAAGFSLLAIFGLAVWLMSGPTAQPPVAQLALTVQTSDSGPALPPGQAGLPVDSVRPAVPNNPPSPTTRPVELRPEGPASLVPFQRAEPSGKPDTRFFTETGHNLTGLFREYWEQNGGLARFGLPLCEEWPEDGHTVQYFERARFELVPAIREAGARIQLGLLGSLLTAGRAETVFQPVASLENTDNLLFFKETGHTVQGEFKAYWEANGGLAGLGLPLSQEFEELNPADSKPYTTQYFERARLEYNPANRQFQLGLLGLQLLKQRGWLS